MAGWVAQQMVLDSPTVFRRLILVGTAPRGGADIMHLDKPSLARHLQDPSNKGYTILQKIFFTPTPSGQTAGAAFVERLTEHWLGENLPNAVLLAYPDAGHGSLFQYYESFARHAAAFLSMNSESAVY